MTRARPAPAVHRGRLERVVCVRDLDVGSLAGPVDDLIENLREPPSPS
jgi:hypothetical protein